MRWSEIIKEDEFDGQPEMGGDGMDDMIEDEAETRGDMVLATALEELRNRAKGHSVPRVRADALVNLVKRLPGGEMFNAAALEDSRKSNETIKNLIADIKDDENGVKYVYLTTDDDSVDSLGGSPGADADAVKSQNTVDQMASRAAGG
jgi:hypothetical protein